MIGKISGQYGVDAVRGNRARKGVSSDALSAASDEAAFSSFAVELARIDAEMKNVPDVRAELVEQFRQEVEAGTYVPQLDQVAHSLIVAGLLDVQ